MGGITGLLVFGALAVVGMGVLLVVKIRWSTEAARKWAAVK